MCKNLNNDFYFASEALSRREAWQWLVENAESRSEIRYSIRFIGKEWKWHKSKVETFLKTLKKLGFITTEVKSARTSITMLHNCGDKQDICKLTSHKDHSSSNGNLYPINQTEIVSQSQASDDSLFGQQANAKMILSQDGEGDEPGSQVEVILGSNLDDNQVALSPGHLAVQLNAQTNSRQFQDIVEPTTGAVVASNSYRDSSASDETSYHRKMLEGLVSVAKTDPGQLELLPSAKEEEKKKRTKKRKEEERPKNTPYGSVKKSGFLENFSVNLPDENLNAQVASKNVAIVKVKAYEDVEVSDILIWTEQTLPDGVALAYELDKFKDYWQSTRKKPPKDGVAAFRNWLRRSLEFNHTKRSNHATTNHHKSETSFERFLAGGARALAQLKGN